MLLALDVRPFDHASFSRRGAEVAGAGVFSGEHWSGGGLTHLVAMAQILKDRAVSKACLSWT